MACLSQAPMLVTEEGTSLILHTLERSVQAILRFIWSNWRLVVRSHPGAYNAPVAQLAEASVGLLRLKAMSQSGNSKSNSEDCLGDCRQGRYTNMLAEAKLSVVAGSNPARPSIRMPSNGVRPNDRAVAQVVEQHYNNHGKAWHLLKLNLSGILSRIGIGNGHINHLM